MKTNTVCLFLFGSLLSISGMAQPGKDSTQVKRNYTIDEVVVTGTRNETDIRHLPMTISVVGRQQIEKRYEPSLLPLLTEQVPDSLLPAVVLWDMVCPQVRQVA